MEKTKQNSLWERFVSWARQAFALGDDNDQCNWDDGDVWDEDSWRDWEVWRSENG